LYKSDLIPAAAAIPLITLVGPPNSGKTTLFNFLSGKNFKTVNYPGSTVDYSVCKLQEKFKVKANLLDSPGIISLIPGSPDEQVAVNFLYSHPDFGTPDIVLTTVDASQFSRHLLLARQLLASGFKVIIILTMTDILKKKGFIVSASELERELNTPVVVVNGKTGEGIHDLAQKIEVVLRHHIRGAVTPRIPDFTGKKELLDSYNEIEKIEKKVLFPLADPVKIAAANKKLKVLADPSVKQECYKVDSTTLSIDKYLLNKKWGLLFFFVIMSLTFSSIFWLADPLMGLVDELFGTMSSAAYNLLGTTWFSDLISNGVISGTGAVMVFIPQILILFLILGLLEDSGYLARGAMLVDKPLSKIGLNGKSFVPMLSGFACAIPAMMAARTIPNRKERLLTIFILPLMSCSARLPVYALLIAFIIPPDNVLTGGIILAGIYIFGIFSSVLIAGIINKFRDKIIKEEDNSSFILELPAYRMPKFSIVVSNAFISTKLYLKKAGPIILAFSVVIWLLTYFPNHSPEVDTGNLSEDEIVQVQNSERLAGSYAAQMGKFIQPVMEPVGMDWRVGVSLISAFAAREVFVSSLALIFKVTDDESQLQSSIIYAMREARIEETGRPLFTTATIAGLIVFFIFALQCISTIAVSRKETGNWRIPMLQVVMFTSLAYFMMFITVNGLRLLGVE
jgi:ferrous iron transport protein B